MSKLIFDYAVFGLLIVASFTFNIYNNVSGPKEKTKADYVFATGRSTSTWAMLLSIARGFLGVRVFLGYPSELFYRGSSMWETMYGMCLAFPVVAYFFVPIYFSLGITSVYQYLDLRFKSRLVRCLASGTYVFRSILNLGVTVFTPCVALKTVIGMPYWASITGISFLGILLNTLGGLRSAIMADVIQGLAMIGCSAIVIIQGTVTAENGPETVFTKSLERGRLDFFQFDLDPTIRVTTISALVGQFFISLSLYGCQQNFVQRYLSMKSIGKVIKTLWINVPFMASLMSLSWIVGMVIFAHYADCDPYKLGYISHIDEIVPFYIQDRFAFLPGFLGLTMAVLFNGGLSLLVSNLNSIATVIWEDFFSQLKPMKKLKDKQQLHVIKLIGIITGLFVMGISYIVSFFSGVIESSMLMTSATSGPLLGVFILALFVPVANWKGASAGMIISHIITIWITVGSLLSDKPETPFLPTTVDECTNNTFSHIPPGDLSKALWKNYYSSLLQTVDPSNISEIDFVEDYKDSPNNDVLSDLEITATKQEEMNFPKLLFRMTYMYYALIGTIITVVVGTIVGLLTGMTEEERYSDTLVHPSVRKICSWFSGGEGCFETESTKKKTVLNVNEKKSDFPNQKISLEVTGKSSSVRKGGFSNDAFLKDSVNYSVDIKI